MCFSHMVSVTSLFTNEATTKVKASAKFFFTNTEYLHAYWKIKAPNFRHPRLILYVNQNLLTTVVLASYNSENEL